jgi:hypothetical protein
LIFQRQEGVQQHPSSYDVETLTILDAVRNLRHKPINLEVARIDS